MDIQKKYSYSFPTNIRFGVGVIKELPKYLSDHNLGSVLIVTDPTVKELHFTKALEQSIQNMGISSHLFSDLSKNPVKSDVLKGKEKYIETKSDCILGLGGGVAMDVARAIALCINNQRDLFDYDDLIGGSIHVTEPIPHFITAPTTAGTGSEVGRSAIISEDESKKKRILFHPSLLAKMVFADPELTYELPDFITAATGMDALTHNMEAYLAKGFNPMCDGIALEGIRLISSSLPATVNKPNPESRTKMLMGSLMGAVAFQKGLGVVHSMAHPLSSLLDMHHGLANAICIPYGMEFNIPGQEDRFRQMALAMDLGETDGKDVIESLHRLNQKIGIPAQLSDAGVEES
ncbi:MAG TPA: iron-containing alcohol dehydrogenase, partial [Flavobacteriales bacterium]|nr:iron-containing alcohol dehydrogenase [Flavobacteriales bacterium]